MCSTGCRARSGRGTIRHSTSPSSRRTRSGSRSWCTTVFGTTTPGPATGSTPSSSRPCADLYREFDELGIQYAFYLERNGDDAEARRPPGSRPHWSTRLPRGAGRHRLLPHVHCAAADPLAPPQGGDARCRRGLGDGRAGPLPRARALDRGLVPAPAHGALPHFLHRPSPSPGGSPAVVDLPFESDGPDGQHRGPWWRRATSTTPSPPRPPFAAGRWPRASNWSDSWSTACPATPRIASDPNANATSGLSPYLHFGNISPIEVVLRASEAGPGGDFAKFQDEILTWRELAFNFTHFNPRHRKVEAMPEWARRELRRRVG